MDKFNSYPRRQRFVNGEPTFVGERHGSRDTYNNYYYYYFLIVRFVVGLYKQCSAKKKKHKEEHCQDGLVLCLGWNVRLIVSLPRRYGVMTLRYNRRTASQSSHVVRQNLQKRKLRVLNPARIHVFYWFNWLNLIGS